MEELVREYPFYDMIFVLDVKWGTYKVTKEQKDIDVSPIFQTLGHDFNPRLDYLVRAPAPKYFDYKPFLDAGSENRCGYNFKKPMLCNDYMSSMLYLKDLEHKALEYLHHVFREIPSETPQVKALQYIDTALERLHMFTKHLGLRESNDDSNVYIKPENLDEYIRQEKPLEFNNIQPTSEVWKAVHQHKIIKEEDYNEFVQGFVRAMAITLNFLHKSLSKQYSAIQSLSNAELPEYLKSLNFAGYRLPPMLYKRPSPPIKDKLGGVPKLHYNLPPLDLTREASQPRTDLSRAALTLIVKGFKQKGIIAEENQQVKAQLLHRLTGYGAESLRKALRTEGNLEAGKKLDGTTLKPRTKYYDEAIAEVKSILHKLEQEREQLL